MSWAARKFYYNRLNPDEPLGPGDERNVEIDPAAPDAVQPRGANWVDILARGFELSDTPVYEFFTGLPGSGKSTELRRLADRLEKGEARLLPVIVDAEDVLDVFSEIDIPDIVVMMLHSVERKVLQAEGRNPGDALKTGYLARIRYWLTNTEVDLKTLKLGATVASLVPLEPEMELEIKTQKSFRDKMRERVAAHLTTFLEHARDEARSFDQRAKRLRYNGIALIVDSLEKLRGTSTNWSQVLSSAEKIFAGEAPYLRLGLHTVYTIPPALVLRLRIPVHFMPMLKLKDRGGVPFDEGFEAARQLVAKRLPNEALREVFGDRFEDRVRELIEWSGGYPREIVRLLKNCVKDAPVSEPLFRRLLGDAADAYRRILSQDSFNVLAGVAVEKRLVFTDQERSVVDQVLTNNVVLRYRNDEEWFDLHPALSGHPPIDTAIAQRRKVTSAPIG